MSFPLKWKIQRFKELPSTNSLAQQLAAENAPEGTVIVADYQTSGRGKPGRQWISPAGKNLLFSILLRPPVSAAEAPLLTQIACRSVAKILKDQYKIESAFKRPNDILVSGKKICGILVEAASSNHKVESVVVGIGLNVNASAKDLIPEAVSMKELNHQEFDRKKILMEILDQFREDIQSLYAHSS